MNPLDAFDQGMVAGFALGLLFCISVAALLAACASARRARRWIGSGDDIAFRPWK